MVDHAMKGFSDLRAAFDKGRSRKSMDLDDSQSQPLPPPVAAAQETSPVKEKLAKMRKLMEEEAAGTGAGSSGSSHVATSQILEAISAVSHKLDKKVDKTDMDALTENLKQHCKVTVAEAVDPLKSELHDLKDSVHNLKGRVLAIESGPSRTATPGVNKDVAQLQKLVQDLDPSKKQVAFTGCRQPLLLRIASRRSMSLLVDFAITIVLQAVISTLVPMLTASWPALTMLSLALPKRHERQSKP